MKFVKSGEFREVAAIAIVLLTIVGFVEDIYTTRGMDDWVWYFVALVLTVFLRMNYLPLILAGVFSVLTLTGYYFSPPGSMNTDLPFINCLMGIGVLWVTAAIIFCRHRLESRWQRSERQHRILFKNMQAGFVHARIVFKGNKPVDFIYLSVNPAFYQITGLTGVIGRRVTEVVPGIERAHPELFEIYGKIAMGGPPKLFEYYLETSKVWLSVSAYCPSKGCFAAIYENITERKRAEGATNLFRTLIDRSNDGIEVVDPETGRFCDVNEVTCRKLGYTREELLALRVVDVTPNVKPEAWPEIIADLRQRRSLVVEGFHQRKDGTLFPTEASIRWVELDREYIVVVVRDITDRKLADEVIRKNQEQMRLFVEQAPISIAMLDRDMRYIITSHRWLEEYGQGLKDVTGRSHYDVVPDVPVAWKEVHQRSLAGEFLRNDEDCWVQADGSKIWLRWAVHPWRNADGEIGGIIISTENITEWKKAEDAVRQSEDRLRMVTENARVGLVMVNRERRYTFANGAYYEVLGLPAGKNIVGERIADVLAPLYEEQIRPRLDRAFAGERMSYELRKPYLGADRFFAVKYEPTYENGVVTRIVVVITDITEQKRASEEIQKQLDELQRWHSVMVGREERIISLKQEVNELLTSRKQGRRYAEINTL